MMRLPILIICCCFILFPKLNAQTDHTKIAQWLQDAAWDEILNSANTNPNPDAYLLQAAGYASFQSGDKSAASAYFDRVLTLDSVNRVALYYNSAILKGDENCPAAIPLLIRLCRLVPLTAAYHVMLADCYTVQSMKKEAVGELLLAKKLSPSSVNITNLLANAWIRLKAYDSASVLLTDFMKSHPGEAVLFNTSISLAYSRKQYKRASSYCDSLVTTGKLKYESLLAGLYSDIELKQFAHAIRLGTVLMELGNDPEEVLYYTALAYQGLGNWHAADTLLRKCIGKVLKPNLNAYYIALGEGEAHEKHLSQSAACYDTAYYLFHQPLTLYRKGLTMESVGRTKESMEAYRQYLNLPLSQQDTLISHYLKSSKILN